MHLHTLVDRERKRSRERVEGVVLVVIQITGDPSADRTAPPRSTHVQPGDISHALIQQRIEGEVEDDSVQQQHNGVVVVEERGNPTGLRQAPAEEKEVSREGGRRPWSGSRS